MYLKSKLYLTVFITASFFLNACVQGQTPKKSTLGGFLDKVGQAAGQAKGGPLSNDEIVRGLKEALRVGISNGSAQASALDGYFKNDAIKLLFPPDVQRVESTLRQVGLGKEVDRFVLSLNRAAEDAAKRAQPIFVNAITSMSIQDAVGILKGEKTAATQYLRRTTYQGLYGEFFPVIDSALNATLATKYYADLVSTYNKIPLVQRVNPDLKKYATERAVDGLFLLVQEEERKIRENPAARVNDILKRVFGQ